MSTDKAITAAASLIDRWLAYKTEMSRIPGLSVGIIYKNQSILHQTYGYANLEERIPTRKETVYRIASFSKTFSAIAVMQLAEQGKLNLDVPVSTYVPWFTNPHDPRVASITLRQLLSHTSGLDRDGTAGQWVTLEFPELSVIQQHVSDGAMVFDPATQWKYSNVGYTIVGQVIEAVSGEAYTEYMTRHIIEPLGLRHTAPDLNAKAEQELAVGYSRDIPGQPRERFPQISTRVMASATGFLSNVPDLLRYIQAQFPGDITLLSEESKREMRRIQWLGEGGGNDQCLGFATWKVNDWRVYGHGGGFQGFITRFAFDPNRQIGIAVLTNAIDGPALTLVNGALSVINKYIVDYDELAKVEFAVEHPERFVGTYRTIWGDSQIAHIGQSLLRYDPSADMPLEFVERLSPNADGSFTVTSGNAGGAYGEKIYFTFDEAGTAQTLISSGNTAERIK